MTSKELNLQLENIRATQVVTSTYQQVAAMRMRKIKDTVMQNRDFYNSLSEVYAETLSYYLQLQKDDPSLRSEHQRKNNGRTVAVLLTANTGLYGSVIRNTYNLFLKEQQNSDNDVAVVGRLGRNWIQPPYPFKSVRYFDLPDGANILDSGIKEIFDYVSEYATIIVYHGMFKNIAQQPPQATRISEKIPAKNSTNETLPFLFEPTIDKVLEVFEKQLMYSFFDQSFYESSLAKFGSRMMSLDAASQNTSKALARLELSLIKMKHRKQNKKQIESLSGVLMGRI